MKGASIFASMDLYVNGGDFEVQLKQYVTTGSTTRGVRARLSVWF